jgi:hypothetical protein
MKIKLSKTQWTEMGKKAGWIKSSSKTKNIRKLAGTVDDVIKFQLSQRFQRIMDDLQWAESVAKKGTTTQTQELANAISSSYEDLVKINEQIKNAINLIRKQKPQ